MHQGPCLPWRNGCNQGRGAAEALRMLSHCFCKYEFIFSSFLHLLFLSVLPDRETRFATLSPSCPSLKLFLGSAQPRELCPCCPSWSRVSGHCWAPRACRHREKAPVPAQRQPGVEFGHQVHYPQTITAFVPRRPPRQTSSRKGEQTWEGSDSRGPASISAAGATKRPFFCLDTPLPTSPLRKRALSAAGIVSDWVWEARRCRCL